MAAHTARGAPGGRCGRGVEDGHGRTFEGSGSAHAVPTSRAPTVLRQAARAAWGVEGDALSLAQYRRQQLLRYHRSGDSPHLFDDDMSDQWNEQQARMVASSRDSPTDDGADARWFDPLLSRFSPDAQLREDGDDVARAEDQVDALVDALDRRVCRAVSQLENLFSPRDERQDGAAENGPAPK